MIGLAQPAKRGDDFFGSPGREIPASTEAASALIELTYQRSATVAEIVADPMMRGFDLDVVMQALFAGLMAEQLRIFSHAAPTPDVVDCESYRVSHPLNRFILDGMFWDRGYAPLASEIVGGAVTPPARIALCLWALSQNAPIRDVIFTCLSNWENPVSSIAPTRGWVDNLVTEFEHIWLPSFAQWGVVERQ